MINFDRACLAYLCGQGAVHASRRWCSWPSPCLPLSLAPSSSLCLSLSHTRAVSLSLSRTHTLTHTRYLFLSRAHTHAVTLTRRRCPSLSLSLSHTHTLSLARARALSLSRTHTNCLAGGRGDAAGDSGSAAHVEGQKEAQEDCRQGTRVQSTLSFEDSRP